MSNFHEINFARIADGESEVELSSFQALEHSSSSPEGLISQSSPGGLSNEVFNLDFGGKSTWFEGSFNFVNSILGAGIIGVPLAIMQCGLVVGVLVYALVAYFVYSSVLMLIQCGIKTRTFDLEELAEHTLGSLGYCMAVGSMFFMSYGGLVAYLVIIGDTMPMVANSISSVNALHNREAAICIFATCIILPLCLFRDLSHLAWTSLLSVLLEMGLLLVVILAAYQKQTSSEHTNSASSTVSSAAVSYLHLSLFAGIGTMSFGLVCQHNSFLVFKSLQQPTIQTWKKLAGSSVSFGFLLSLAFGLVGFFAFYPHVEGDILNNFSANSHLVTAGRSILAATMLFTYPLECYVSRHCLYSLISRYRNWRRAQRSTSSCHCLRNRRRGLLRGNHQRLSSSGPRLSSRNDFDDNDDLPELTWWQQLWSWRRRRSQGRSRARSNSQRQQVVIGFELTPSTNTQHFSSSGHKTDNYRQDSDNPIHYANNEEASERQPDEDMVVISFREEEEQEEKLDSSSANPPRMSKSIMTMTSRFMNRLATRQHIVNMGYFADDLAADRSTVDMQNPLHSNVDDNNDEEGQSDVDESSDDQPQQSNKSNNGDEHHGFASTYEHVFWTVILWGSSLLIAIVSKKLGVVSALTGAAAASTLGYTLPALIYLKVYEKELYQAVSVLLGIPPANESGNEEARRNVARSSFWQALKKLMLFMLPISMLLFGVAVFFVGITTVLMAAS